MDKFDISQSINISANSNNIEEVIEKGKNLCDYLMQNISEVKNNGRVSFHIGSALYFYQKALTDKSNTEFKFTLSSSVINLYESLQFRDVQSLMAAYRLHLLIMSNIDFFKKTMMHFIGTPNKLFEMSSEDINKYISGFIYHLEYGLFSYCMLP